MASPKASVPLNTHSAALHRSMWLLIAIVRVAIPTLLFGGGGRCLPGRECVGTFLGPIGASRTILSVCSQQLPGLQGPYSAVRTPSVEIWGQHRDSNRTPRSTRLGLYGCWYQLMVLV